MKKHIFRMMPIALFANFLFTISAISAEWLSIPPPAFVPLSTTSTYSISGRSISTELSRGDFNAPVLLPHNAVIDRVLLEAYDDSNGIDLEGRVQVSIHQWAYDMVMFPNYICTVATTAEFAGGYASVSLSGVNHTVNNLDYYYVAFLTLQNTPDPTESAYFLRLRIGYHLPKLTLSEPVPPP
jgi:hypothetical protein